MHTSNRFLVLRKKASKKEGKTANSLIQPIVLRKLAHYPPHPLSPFAPGTLQSEHRQPHALHVVEKRIDPDESRIPQPQHLGAEQETPQLPSNGPIGHLRSTEYNHFLEFRAEMTDQMMRPLIRKHPEIHLGHNQHPSHCFPLPFIRIMNT